MKFQPNHIALCTTYVILKYYLFPSGGFCDKTWFSHLAWIMKSKFEPPYSMSRHISWCSDRNIGAFPPQYLHSRDSKKSPFFRTSSNHDESQMGQGLLDVYHFHECLDRNQLHFFEIRYRCKKVKKLMSDFVIDIDIPMKYKNNDIKHSSLFQVFVEITFGILSQ